MHASEIWHSSRAQARLCRAALLPASLLYQMGWQAYLSLYQLGIKRPKEPHSPVVCVGNLQVGGSGKTPFALALARYLLAQGHELIVSSSGYGSPRSESASLAPTGELSAREWGDEAAMMRWLEPNLNLVVGRNRVTAARLVHETHPQAVMLMDDGFQHLPLKKHVAIVLDPSQPSNPWCLPAGPYREPRSNRRRADLLIPGDLTLTYLPTTLKSPEGEVGTPPRYSILCALGNPQRFLEDLRTYCPPRQGLGEVRLRPDHDPMSDDKLLEGFSREVPVVVTAKDWVKLRERNDLREHRFLIATQDLIVEGLEAVERRIRTGT